MGLGPGGLGIQFSCAGASVCFSMGKRHFIFLDLSFFLPQMRELYKAVSGESVTSNILWFCIASSFPQSLPLEWSSNFQTELSIFFSRTVPLPAFFFLVSQYQGHQHSFIQQLLTEHAVGSSDCSRYWWCSSEQEPKSLPWRSSYILAGVRDGNGIL